MKCLKCGTECADKAAFCDWCGEKLHGDSVNLKCQTIEYPFAQALTDYWNKAFEFGGRARRKEFWYACLWNFAFLLIINAVGRIVSKDLQFALEIVFYSGLLLPNVSLAIRRVHDIGISGYWLFIGLIPILGHIALAVIFALNGERCENKYGESTKYISQNISI